MGVVRRYRDIVIILLISTPLVLALLSAASLLLCSFFRCFFILFISLNQFFCVPFIFLSFVRDLLTLKN